MSVIGCITWCVGGCECISQSQYTHTTPEQTYCIAIDLSINSCESFYKIYCSNIECPIIREVYRSPEIYLKLLFLQSHMGAQWSSIVTHMGLLIDHILINSQTFKNDNEIITGNIYSGITDHLPNFIIIKSECKIPKERPMIRIFSEKYIEKFQSMIMAMEPWDEFYATKDTGLALEIFYKIYNSIL